MITVREIKEIFEGSKYKGDLSELSSYAESVMQERYMVLLLSKYLYPRHKIKLEKHFPLAQPGKHGIHDLVVVEPSDETSIEFKFHYDFDVHYYLTKELDKYKGETDEGFWKAFEKEIHTTWSITPGIYKDVWTKKADIFVWVICERDLSGVKEADLDFINQGVRQQKYENKLIESGSKESISTKVLESVNSLLERLKRRPYSIEEVRISTTGCHFPSTYHLRLCKFERTH